MMLRRSGLLLVAVAVVYVVVLAFADTERSVFNQFGKMADVLPVLMAASFGAYAVRFTRWRLLLTARGDSIPFMRGFLAYLAGFAFTASPGKAGELIRVRYFSQMGVPPVWSIGCFVFERVLDLIVLLLLASPLVGRSQGMGLAVSFVAILSLGILAVAYARRPRIWLQYRLRGAGYRRLARLSRALLGGIAKITMFMTARYAVPGVLLGLAAWTLQCLGFVVALQMLGVNLPWILLWSVPPAAMLIGAASMVPGGIGTTETATVVLLTHFGTDLQLALLAAIAMRLGSIWFATLIGLAAVSVLESRSNKAVASAPRA